MFALLSPNWCCASHIPNAHKMSTNLAKNAFFLFVDKAKLIGFHGKHKQRNVLSDLVIWRQLKINMFLY